MTPSPNEAVILPKILLIDDDSLLSDLIAGILEMQGHSVMVAENGIQGVAKHRADVPDLVITDMIMPEQGGAETIIIIRRETPDARIIAISGGGTLDGTHPLIVAKKLGAMETLNKPFTEEELTDCVTRSLSHMPSPNIQRSPASHHVRDRLPPRTI
jgi:DNA-binding NtrC family response regulator